MLSILISLCVSFWPLVPAHLGAAASDAASWTDRVRAVETVCLVCISNIAEFWTLRTGDIYIVYNCV